MAVSAEPQEKKIKIGVIFDLTGRSAGGGFELPNIQASKQDLAFGTILRPSGVRGYKDRRYTPDAQRGKPDCSPIQQGGRAAWSRGKATHADGFFHSAQCVAGCCVGRLIEPDEEIHVGSPPHFLPAVDQAKGYK